MPTYVYRCPACGAPDLDIVHGMTEHVAVICPECGELRHRVPQVTGIALKGGGWAGKEEQS
jgi:putative FmdB family regulatory protein